MWFTIRQYFLLAHLAFFKGARRGVAMTSGRLLFLFSFFTLFPLVQVVNGLCLLLDNLFFPAYRRIEIRRPVFVVGPPRSGTTLLHRLMAKDTDTFFFFRTWELMFPSILQKKFIHNLGRLDERFGGHVAQAIARLQEKRFAGFDHLHRIRTFLPEEDDKLFSHNLASLDLVWFFPFIELTPLGKFDRSISEADRKRIMRFYMACVQRQAYFKGADKCFLSKNPMFSPKVQSIRETFPDCRFVLLIRNPYEAIPSMTNMALEIWQNTINSKPIEQMREAIYQTLLFFYRHPLENLLYDEGGPDLIVEYARLISDPDQVLRDVYQHLDIRISQKFSEILRQETERMLAYKSSHSYSLADSPVAPERIGTDLDAMIRRFEFSPSVNRLPAAPDLQPQDAS